MGGDEQVERADGRARSFQLSADHAVVPCGRNLEGQHGKTRQEPVHGQALSAGRTERCTPTSSSAAVMTDTAQASLGGNGTPGMDDEPARPRISATQTEVSSR